MPETRVQSLGQGPQPPRTPVITAARQRPGSCAFSGVMVGSKMASASRFVQHSKGSKSPDWLMHQGPPDTAEIIKTLPQKYRRKLVSQKKLNLSKVEDQNNH
uniref:Uncharacterized protein n=1 Tax=Bos mutus grunniens TaxID=30521 RepID=A0A8B9YFP5_BOSMU